MSINYKRIGERIQTARKMKGWSTTELAEMVHFTAKSIAFAESGQASLSLEFLMALCTALNITPNDLFAGEYQSDRKDSLEHDVELTELRDLVESMRDEMGLQKSSVVLKDTQTVIEEFRQAVVEYKKEIAGNEKAEKKKKSAHW